VWISAANLKDNKGVMTEAMKVHAVNYGFIITYMQTINLGPA
jgi:hypothetical protein